MIFRIFLGMIKGVGSFLKMFLRYAIVHGSNSTLKNPFPTNWCYDTVSSIKIGDHVSIGPFSEIVIQEQTRFSDKLGGLVLGDRVSIGYGANIRAAGGLIVLEKNALLAQNVSLIAAGHKIDFDKLYRDAEWDNGRTGVSIAENAWLGAGVVVLPGCKVGRNSIVGAGAVVTRDVPDNEVWAGVPARLVKRN